MGVTMMCRVGARSALALATAVSVTALSAQAFAAELPQVKTTQSNKVPQCATPGRLTAFLESRNSKLDEKFATIAADYMRVGEELGIRWDVAFFQMLLETGNLTFTGDVSPGQNNFAGLGATGKREPGESFPDVATGVKAHLQHLLMYAGETVDNPVAERTRKVQEWGVLTSWQKSLKGPATYDQLARKWAPGSRNYSRDIANVSDAFYSGPCKSDDPKPEMMALVHPDKAAPVKTAEAKMDADPDQSAAGPAKISGADLARKANEEARASGSFVRSGLGASSLIGEAGDAAKEAAPAATAKAQPAVTIINAPKPPEAEVAAAASAAAAPAVATSGDKAKIETTALGAGTKPAATPPSAVKEAVVKCKVWTASYGGARSVIIKASADAQVNYTVLDVNEGSEKREADAYIAAYAKGGQTVGEYSSQNQALDKAFELCPEG
jgi:hypothetical protein